MRELMIMSTMETERIPILDRLMKKEIRQRQAAKLLRLSVRQIRRLVKKYKHEGAVGLVHTLRGKESNRRIEKSVINKAIEVIREKYSDFGPTLAHEKLVENHNITFSRETLRQAMIKEEIWKRKQRRMVILHQLRERREALGELVQVDGSPHDWFEGRSPCCTLLVFIDDATGKLLRLEFAESESTASYLLAVKHYLKKNGKPLVFYVDKHGVFRVNTTKAGTAGTEDANGVTQFGRAMRELSIEVIFANSAEAKGRVERVNQTLQDRLVKELRLKGISTIEEANIYLPEFMEMFNRKFAVVPKSPVNMHRPLLSTEKLENILCQKYTRILSRQLTLSYGNKIYQIQTNRPTYAMRYAPVVVKEDVEGNIAIFYKNQPLAYTIFHKQPKTEIADSKQLNIIVDRIAQRTGIINTVAETPWIPPKDHPWRQYQFS